MLVLATFKTLIGASQEAQEKMRVLNLFFYICYQAEFQKHESNDILALILFYRKINTKTSTYVAKLGL